ncbi:MAG: helix-turn-helix domain-containing protein [Acidobacteria bacterium]|nr:MAG: helix-turn-helix domain-containing protein [Acidobacteriota bacterium]
MAVLLTSTAVAERFGVTGETVRRWAREGLIQAITLPSGQIRFRPEDIDALMAPTEAS